MHETAGKHEVAEEKRIKKEKNKASFGWNVFNTDAMYKGYEKRLAHVPNVPAGAWGLLPDDDDLRGGARARFEPCWVVVGAVRLYTLSANGGVTFVAENTDAARPVFERNLLIPFWAALADTPSLPGVAGAYRASAVGAACRRAQRAQGRGRRQVWPRTVAPGTRFFALALAGSASRRWSSRILSSYRAMRSCWPSAMATGGFAQQRGPSGEASRRARCASTRRPTG